MKMKMLNFFMPRYDLNSWSTVATVTK